jgi:hypothetical protein
LIQLWNDQEIDMTRNVVRSRGGETQVSIVLHRPLNEAKTPSEYRIIVIEAFVVLHCFGPAILGQRRLN